MININIFGSMNMFFTYIPKIKITEVKIPF